MLPYRVDVMPSRLIPQILTAADDKTVRLFDVASGQEVNRMDIPSNPTDLELSQDSSVITVSFGTAKNRRLISLIDL